MCFAKPYTFKLDFHQFQDKHHDGNIVQVAQHRNEGRDQFHRINQVEQAESDCYYRPLASIFLYKRAPRQERVSVSPLSPATNPLTRAVYSCRASAAWRRADAPESRPDRDRPIGRRTSGESRRSNLHHPKHR